MKKINRIKLMALVLILSTSLSSFIIASYAWGTASRFVNLAGLQIGILNDAKIEMGLRNKDTGLINYYANDELSEDVLETNGINTKGFFKPVSSSFESKWKKKDVNNSYSTILPKFTKDYSTTSEIQYPGEATYGFRQFELFFRCDEPVNISFSAETLLFADTAANHEYVLAHGGDEEKMNKIFSAMRISLLTPSEYYIIDPSKKDDETDKETYYGGRLVGKELGYYASDEVDGKVKETVYGEYDADKLIYKDKLLEDEGTNQSDSIFIGKSKKGTYPLDVDNSIANGAFAKEKSYSIDSLAKENTIIKNWTKDEEGKVSLSEQRVVISYYLEGWDIDNIDSMASATFKSKVVFTGDYAYKDIYTK